MSSWYGATPVKGQQQLARLHWRPPLRSPSSGENTTQSVNLILPPALDPGVPWPYSQRSTTVVPVFCALLSDG